ncbi:phage terminase large subunit family protein [Nitrospirillum viridazoti]|nr:terminase gpA endonuclease subunit [Nitrospirillum amazonense]TWB33079.1 phage terminase large subunit GpA-like protein [Nitrospirillum amazonense]
MHLTTPLRSHLPHLANGVAAALAGFGLGAKPPIRRTVPEWAAKVRMVSAESGSSYADGKDVPYLHENAPHMVEVMECLSLQHPSFEVTMMGSAQIAKSEAGLNLIGSVIDDDPSPILVLLPSLDEQKKYIRLKLQPMIEATPSLRDKVRSMKSRDEDGSTSSMKKFRGGYVFVATASSSKALQMVSYRIIVGEEVTEWPLDVGGRGDPQDQAIHRTKAYRERRGAKCYWPATPGVLGSCRITVKYERGDMRRRYVACPHCGAWQVLKFENLRWDQETAPFGAYFLCASGHGCVITQADKDEMMWGGVWLKTYPVAEDDDTGDEAPGPVVLPDQIERFRRRPSRGREPSFAIWQAYSMWVSWEATVKEWLDARGNPEKEKAFSQQVKGEAWEEKGDAPPAEKLLALREDFPSQKLPPGALFITAHTDVQGYGLKGDVYAWGEGMECWRIDGWTIEGDPADDRVWALLAERVRRRYEDCHGQWWQIDAFGVDSGYLSPRVYKFARDMKRQGYERVFATDGMPGPSLPPIGMPTKVLVNWRGKREGTVLKWPIGTWPMKLEVFGALNRLLRSSESAMDPDGNPWRGLPHFNGDVDLTFFKEVTAEYLKVGERGGKPFREWIKTGVNDRLDTFVGARALASHVLNEAGADKSTWAALAAARKPAGPPQGDLLSAIPLMNVRVATTPSAPPPTQDDHQAPDIAPEAAVTAELLARKRRVVRSSFVKRR